MHSKFKVKKPPKEKKNPSYEVYVIIQKCIGLQQILTSYLKTFHCKQKRVELQRPPFVQKKSFDYTLLLSITNKSFRLQVPPSRRVGNGLVADRRSRIIIISSFDFQKLEAPSKVCKELTFPFVTHDARYNSLKSQTFGNPVYPSCNPSAPRGSKNPGPFSGNYEYRVNFLPMQICIGSGYIYLQNNRERLEVARINADGCYFIQNVNICGGVVYQRTRWWFICIGFD